LAVVLGALAVGLVIGLRPALAPLVLAAPFAVGAAWVAFRAPGLTFAAYLTVPFYKAATDGFMPIDLTVVLAALNVMQAGLLFLTWFEQHGTSRVTLLARRRALRLWFTLTVLIVLGVLYSPLPDVALERAMNWVILAALPLLAAFRVISEPRYLRQFLWSTFAVGAAVTVAGLILLPGVGAWPADRLIVFGAHTIRVGQAALLVPMVVFAYIIPTSGPLVRLAALAMVPPALLVSISSGSRGPLLFGAITLLLFLLRALISRISRQRGRPIRVAPRRIAMGALALLVVSVLVSLLQPGALVGVLPETAVARISTISEIISGLAGQDLAEAAPDTSTADRLTAYDGAISMFNRSPILGEGTASFAAFVSSSGFADWTVDVAYPHNLILQFAAEYGLVGIAVLLVLLGSAFFNLLPLSRDPAWNAVLVLLVFFLLSAIVSSGIIDNRTLWGLVLMGIAAPTAAVYANPARRHGTMSAPSGGNGA
jgi:O-antigen ligase